MSAAPATPAAQPATKPTAPAKIVVTITWPANEEPAILGKVPPDEQKAIDVIAAAKKFGVVTGFAILGKKKFEF